MSEQVKVKIEWLSKLFVDQFLQDISCKYNLLIIYKFDKEFYL